jgi:uncharacterized membrane protein YphA (DoxX/SURF4 family)
MLLLSASIMLDTHLEKTWWTLRLTYGLVPIVAGLDKFTNLLTDWTQYLKTFMYLVGIIEIAAGILVLTKFTRIGAYVVSAWLLAIVLNLLLTGTYFDIAVRDLVMSIGAFALAKLTEAREGVPATRATPRLEPSQDGRSETRPVTRSCAD